MTMLFCFQALLRQVNFRAQSLLCAGGISETAQEYQKVARLEGGIDLGDLLIFARGTVPVGTVDKFLSCIQ